VNSPGSASSGVQGISSLQSISTLGTLGSLGNGGGLQALSRVQPPLTPSLTPSLANHYREDLTQHVRAFPADILEKQVRTHWAPPFSLSFISSAPPLSFTPLGIPSLPSEARRVTPGSSLLLFFFYRRCLPLISENLILPQLSLIYMQIRETEDAAVFALYGDYDVQCLPTLFKRLIATVFPIHFPNSFSQFIFPDQPTPKALFQVPCFLLYLEKYLALKQKRDSDISFVKYMWEGISSSSFNNDF
jgi:hypothetical protein